MRKIPEPPIDRRLVDGPILKEAKKLLLKKMRKAKKHGRKYRPETSPRLCPVCHQLIIYCSECGQKHDYIKQERIRSRPHVVYAIDGEEIENYVEGATFVRVEERIVINRKFVSYPHKCVKGVDNV